MKKLIYLFTLAFTLISLTNEIVNAQSVSKENPYYFIEIRNEQKATNIMYDILFSFEELTYNWNKNNFGNNSDSLSLQDIRDKVLDIENLMKQYIATIKTPMLDTLRDENKFVTISLVRNRLPTPKEAQVILTEQQLLELNIDAYCKDPNTAHLNEWMEQLKKVKESILSSINY